MALSRRVDLTEEGDFQTERGRFVRAAELTTDPFTNEISNLYRRRETRIQQQQSRGTQSNQITVTLNQTTWEPLQLLDDEASRIVMNRLESIMIFPWTFKNHWEDSKYRDDELVYTGSGKDITRKKGYEILNEGLECQCCGRMSDKTPWRMNYGLCLECDELYDDERFQETTGGRHVFTERIEELERSRRRRLYENSLKLNNLHRLTMIH